MKLGIFLLSIAIGLGLVSLVKGIPPAPVPVGNILPIKEGDPSGGYWQTKSEWKAYWVKSWIPKMIYVPIWKKIWGPVNIKQWVPLPRPPPGWKP